MATVKSLDGYDIVLRFIDVIKWYELLMSGKLEIHLAVHYQSLSTIPRSKFIVRFDVQLLAFKRKPVHNGRRGRPFHYVMIARMACKA